MTAPRFLADEDLRLEIVLATKRLEPSLIFTTVVEEGLVGRSDAEILAYARGHGFVVVSHDVNTLKAQAEESIRAGSGVSGVFLVPQSRLTRPIAESLVVIWGGSNAVEWQDAIVYLPL